MFAKLWHNYRYVNECEEWALTTSHMHDTVSWYSEKYVLQNYTRSGWCCQSHDSTVTPWVQGHWGTCFQSWHRKVSVCTVLVLLSLFLLLLYAHTLLLTCDIFEKVAARHTDVQMCHWASELVSAGHAQTFSSSTVSRSRGLKKLKMLILGLIFRCLDPILTIVACLSCKPLVVSSIDRKEEVTRWGAALLELHMTYCEEQSMHAIPDCEQWSTDGCTCIQWMCEDTGRWRRSLSIVWSMLWKIPKILSISIISQTPNLLLTAQIKFKNPRNIHPTSSLHSLSILLGIHEATTTTTIP